MAVSVRTARRLRTSEELLWAGRSLPWGLVGFGIALAGPMAVWLAAIPTEGYFAGLRLLACPVAMLVALVWILGGGARLCHNLDPDSIFEYLELRFDPATRTWAAALYLLGQVAWLACLLAIVCQAMGPALGGGLGAAAAVVLVGGAAAISACLGGMKASAWTSPGKWLVVAAAILVLLAAVGSALDGRTELVWQTAEELGRTAAIDPTLDWSHTWSTPAAGLCFVLLALFFFVADQGTVGRFLSARDLGAMNRGAVFGAMLAFLALLAAIAVGLGLLAVYHVKAQDELRPNWVANAAVDPQTGRPTIDLGTPIDAATIDDLVARGAILDPNTDRVIVPGPGPRPEKGDESNLPRSGPPGASHKLDSSLFSGLVDGEGRVEIDRLATWDSRPHPSQPRKRTWERRLRRGQEELLPWFVARHVGPGWRGLVLAGLALGALAALESGLIAIGAVLLADFHRRHGWAEAWLARRCGKEPPQLDEADELRLARPVILGAGGAVVALAVALAQVGGLLRLAVLVASLMAAPLLGAFLLGLFTRRATGAAVRVAMAVGTAVTLWLALGCYLAGTTALGGAWPWPRPLGFTWPLPLGFAATLAAGCAMSYVLGKRKARAELKGLVAGLGTWGVVRETPEKGDESNLPRSGPEGVSHKLDSSPFSDDRLGPGPSADAQDPKIVWLGRDDEIGQGPWR